MYAIYLKKLFILRIYCFDPLCATDRRDFWVGGVDFVKVVRNRPNRLYAPTRERTGLVPFLERATAR
jgi:hypothetical protein